MSGGGERITRSVRLFSDRNRPAGAPIGSHHLDGITEIPDWLQDLQEPLEAIVPKETAALPDEYKDLSPLDLFRKGLITEDKLVELTLSRTDRNSQSVSDFSIDSGSRAVTQSNDTQIGPVKKPGILTRRMNEVSYGATTSKK